MLAWLLVLANVGKFNLQQLCCVPPRSERLGRLIAGRKVRTDKEGA